MGNLVFRQVAKAELKKYTSNLLLIGKVHLTYIYTCMIVPKHFLDLIVQVPHAYTWFKSPSCMQEGTSV